MAEVKLDRYFSHDANLWGSPAMRVLCSSFEVPPQLTYAHYLIVLEFLWRSEEKAVRFNDTTTWSFLRLELGMESVADVREFFETCVVVGLFGKDDASFYSKIHRENETAIREKSAFFRSSGAKGGHAKSKKTYKNIDTSETFNQYLSSNDENSTPGIGGVEGGYNIPLGGVEPGYSQGKGGVDPGSSRGLAIISIIKNKKSQLKLAKKRRGGYEETQDLRRRRLADFKNFYGLEAPQLHEIFSHFTASEILDFKADMMSHKKGYKYPGRFREKMRDHVESEHETWRNELVEYYAELLFFDQENQKNKQIETERIEDEKHRLSKTNELKIAKRVFDSLGEEARYDLWSNARDEYRARFPDNDAVFKTSKFEFPLGTIIAEIMSKKNMLHVSTLGDKSCLHNNNLGRF